jgi:hypothetical protein
MGPNQFLFYLVVKVVKSQKKLCSQYELCFLDIFPQFELFKTTIFEETLPDFIKEENTHPPKGRGGRKERNNVQSRREDHQCPTRRWQK